MAKKTKLKTPTSAFDRTESASGETKSAEGFGEAKEEKSAPEAVLASQKDQKDIFSSDGELVVDVFETPADFVVLATIAGVNIKDLDISVEKEMMIIQGNRLDPHDDPEKKYFYQECYFGPFSRKIVLPENIHTEKASAQMDKGMLTIKIPKKDSATNDKDNGLEVTTS